MTQIREVLVLHHSHLDVGYTHSQPVVWEMHREFIDQALRMLVDTEDWPEGSRPRWTCEVTAPLLRWLSTAQDSSVRLLTDLVSQGRVGISAMLYNNSSLCSAEALARQLAPVAELRHMLRARIATVNQHDVNGVPWPLADLMIDAGIELLTMAVNIDHGHFVAPRPGVFFWEAPSGRRLLVMNGSPYTMFDQLLWTWEGSIARMQEGLSRFCARISRSGWPHDFVYLTSTNPPEAWDNSPPNPWVAALIREWNSSAAGPPIRYVTTDDLLARLRGIPPDSIPVLRGDWTDYWSFGVGSAAYETALSRTARRALEEADLLAAGRGVPRPPAAMRAAAGAWENLALYCEHTWSHWDPRPDNPPARAQSCLKAGFAHQAHELARYLLVDELEDLAAHPYQTEQPTHVLIVNPTQRARDVYARVPSQWREPGKRLRSSLFAGSEPPEGPARGEPHGPYRVPAFGWRKIPIAAMKPFRPAAGALSFEEKEGAAVIDTPFYRMTYSPVTGLVTGLLNKSLGWEVLPRDGEYTFFEPVRERPDPRVDGTRNAIYERDLEREKVDQHCWKTGWEAERSHDTRLLSCVVEREPDAITLVREMQAPGMNRLVQRITMHVDSAVIELAATLDKLGCTDPEAIYFAFPLDLPAGWECLFDTAGVPVALDTEQLPGSCRGWMSVDSFVSMHAGGRTAALLCPDATLAQPGGFGFGRLLPEVPRPARPLLLAWPMNNYWHTNFPLSQPGVTRLRYGFLTGGALTTEGLLTEAAEFIHEPLVHPAYRRDDAAEGRLLELEREGVIVNHVKPASDGRGIVVRLINAGAATAVARVRPGRSPAREAWLCGTIEDDRESLPVVDGATEVTLPPRRLTLVRLCS